jgi:SAM-dependent methyltransferase
VKLLLHHPRFSDPVHNLAALQHRQDLVKQWGIQPGDRVLEIGCGQGDFTVAVADAVGPTGSVVALDPMDPRGGTPPLGEAQAHISASPVGAWVTFVRSSGIEYLRSAEQAAFDYVVLCHSVWYMAEPGELSEILAAAAGKTRAVLIAEFAFSASSLAAVPGLLAALATIALEAFRDNSSWRNLRCGLSPRQITAAAERAGWSLQSQGRLQTPPKERYSAREATMVLDRPFFASDVEKLEASDKAKTMLYAIRDALAASVDNLDGGMDDLVNMDVWTGRFEVASQPA